MSIFIQKSKMMLINNPDAVAEAISKRDLTYFDAQIDLSTRTINTKQNYKSPLMISAHKVKHLNKITTLKTDAIILNLEDGVSQEMKPFALRLVMMTLSALPECDKKIIVRVNALDEGGEQEIKALNRFRPDAIRVPKIKTADDVQRVLAICDEAIEVHLSIETKEAWLNLKGLRVHTRVKAFYLGVLDLFADMHLSQELITASNPLMQQVLSQFLLTSKALGIKPISFVFQAYEDEAGFEKWLALEKQMGFEAKGCLSPKQVEQVQKTFGVDEKAILRAQHIVNLFEKKRDEGITGFSDEDHGFIDEPIYKGALALLSRQ